MIFIYCARVCVSVCVGVCDLSFGYFIYEIYIHCDALTDTQIKNRKTDEGERKREREISRSLLINILVCWFHFVYLRVEVLAGCSVRGGLGACEICIALAWFCLNSPLLTLDTAGQTIGAEERNEKNKSKSRETGRNLREFVQNQNQLNFQVPSMLSLVVSLSLSLAIPLFEPHFPFVILHSFCQFLCRSSSLKTNDVIGQFSTLPSRLFTRVTTTTTITTTTVLHNLAFCYTC